MDHDTALHWFRTDLRLHDNEALVEAAAADDLLPVYVVDPRKYGERPYGGPHSFDYEKTGPHRTRFLLESLADLRTSLRDRGSDLVVRRGRPEDVVPALASAVDADRVHFHTYPTAEEVRVEAAVKVALRERDVTPRRYWGHTLHHIDDLPGSADDVDDTFTPFKESVERHSEVRDTYPIPELPDRPAATADAPAATDDSAATTDDSAATTDDAPAAVVTAGDVDPGSIPSPEALGVDPVDPDDRGVLRFEGGETRGRQRVREYLWDRDRLREYRETRNGMIGPDYSSKFSPWLNLGCLSPRYVFEEVRRYEDERVSNSSTYWLLFELRWRDFFQFQFVKHGSQQFRREGIRERDDIEWREADETFRRWCAGRTGVPFVDANMRELNATGYVSNRGRQNVASFLANNCRVDWRRGAAYFEMLR